MEIYVSVVPGTRLRQVFGSSATSDASVHPLPISITAWSQRNSLRGAGPWSQHISLMPRCVELFLTASPAWHSSLPHTPIHSPHTHTHKGLRHLQSSILKILLDSIFCSFWHPLWTAVSCGRDVSIWHRCKNSKYTSLCICTAIIFPFPLCAELLQIYLVAISTTCAHN